MTSTMPGRRPRHPPGAGKGVELVKRLVVLVAANEPAARSLICNVLASRNYRIVEAHLDPAFASNGGGDHEHHLALIAPDGSEASIAAYRAYRQACRSADVRTLVCGGGEAARTAAAEFHDIFVPAPLEREALLAAIDVSLRHLVTILVADDEPLIRRMFGMYLGNEGYRVVTAEDGDDAIRKVKQVIPDLVITDIKMPHVDGYEVCRAIKECRDTQHIPVVIVSALGSELDIDKGFGAGANEYLTKPVDLVELAGRIQNIFRGIQLRGRERVLVVTPSPIECSILAIGLQQQGFEVLAARDGAEAFELAQRTPPSVVVADLEIPVLDIFQLHESMKQSPKLADLPLVVLTSRASKIEKQRRDALAAAAFITKPFPIERLVALIERILGERRTKIEAERDILLQTIRSLVQALEARDKYTRGHSDNVARYTVMIARRILPNEEEISRYQLSAQLHDIGKIGVPDAILLKPGKLTAEEMAIMQTHPGKGSEILAPIPSLRDIIPGVRWHHERLDGKGYPDGLTAAEIPLQARVIAVADTFDALTSNRPYRAGCSIEKALAVIRDAAGTQLDPEIVDVFCRAIEEARLVLPAPEPAGV
jgi:putative two-component system response regulator